MIGGKAIQLGGLPSPGLSLLRINPDGSLDRAFNPVVEGEPEPHVTGIVLQADGKILIIGRFDSVAGQARNGFARIQPDGGLDAGFQPASIQDEMTAIALQPDGRILVGGTTLIRFQPDGTLDTDFGPTRIRKIKGLMVQPDTKILAGGEWVAQDGGSREGVVRLLSDGSLDPGFHPIEASGESFSHRLAPSISVLTLQADGRILIGGGFDALNGKPRRNLARLNPDGGIDDTFKADVNGPLVTALALRATGEILVGGGFENLNAYDLLEISVDNPSEIPETGTRLVILARNPTDDTLHFRIFNDAGTTIVDRTESEYPEASREIASVKSVLARLWDPNVQSDFVSSILELVASITGHSAVNGDRRIYNISRMNNTDSATQNLAYDGSSITWLRGGTAPEVWRTESEFTTDWMSWTALGQGARVEGGWVFADVTIPAGAVIRARGFVSASHTASGGIVESVWCSGSYPPPMLMANDWKHGSAGGSFAFHIQAGVGEEIVLEATSDLVDWTPIQTVVPRSIPFYISDRDSPDHPGRYYRVRKSQ